MGRPDFQRRRMAAKAEMTKVNKIMFGEGMKCCRKECGAAISIAQSRSSVEDHGWALCDLCIGLGISIGKLKDPLDGNPMKDW
jgi:hypothetical protein